MSVYKYVSGAWQEAETPKKYVNSAWEDSDGYAYENGVWVEKWSAFPSNYLIKDGVINPKAEYTTRSYRTLGANDYIWRYDATNKALMSACKAQKISANNYEQYIDLDVTNMFLGSEVYGKTLYLDYKVDSGYYSDSSQLYRYLNAMSQSNYQTSRTTTSRTITNPNASQRWGFLRLLNQYKSASIVVATAYVYNFWYE